MSSTPSSGRGGKKQTKTVVIKLPSSRLSSFPHTKAASKSAGSKSSSDPSTPSAVGKDSPKPAEPSQEVKAETPNETGASTDAPAGKKGPGGKPGLKRGASTAGDGTPKPRAKPGPKRRKFDAVNGEEGGKPWTQSAPTGGHKLGPKANQGAINAGLRALDRSGPPCRKWNKRGFSVKSFTGIVWELPSWTAPKREVKDEPDENGDGKENADGQLVPSSSNVGSETSRQNANDANEATDSPAPVNLISATA